MFDFLQRHEIAIKGFHILCPNDTILIGYSTNDQQVSKKIFGRGLLEKAGPSGHTNRYVAAYMLKTQHYIREPSSVNVRLYPLWGLLLPKKNVAQIAVAVPYGMARPEGRGRPEGNGSL